VHGGEHDINVVTKANGRGVGEVVVSESFETADVTLKKYHKKLKICSVSESREDEDIRMSQTTHK
jgi:hypothetical protein